MKISVIVPTYNEEKFIELCLKALLKQSIPRKDYEIIVSDSSSTDKTVAIAKKYADKVVVCKKLSAGFGRNRGVDKAKGRILAFLDADTIVNLKWIEGILEALDGKKSVAATGPFSTLENDSLLEKIYFALWSFECGVSTRIGFPLLAGFNFAVKKDAFNSVGGFREDNMVCEDFDLSLKLNKIGKIKFNNKMNAATSTRRVREMGMLPYAMHGFMYLLFKKKYTWSDHRKDW